VFWTARGLPHRQHLPAAWGALEKHRRAFAAVSAARVSLGPVMRYPSPLPLVLASMMVLVAGRARASSDYPQAVRGKLGLSRAPDCILCHSDDKGGNGTIVTWFGLSMQDFGVQGKRPDLLDAALDRLREEDTDSDADGSPDIEELQAGTDPNDGPGR